LLTIFRQKAQVILGTEVRFGRGEEVAKPLAFMAFVATHTTCPELVVDGGA
jgi:hypothetical protein